MYLLTCITFLLFHLYVTCPRPHLHPFSSLSLYLFLQLPSTSLPGTKLCITSLPHTPSPTNYLTFTLPAPSSLSSFLLLTLLLYPSLQSTRHQTLLYLSASHTFTSFLLPHLCVTCSTPHLPPFSFSRCLCIHPFSSPQLVWQALNSTHRPPPTRQGIPRVPASSGSVNRPPPPS